MAGFRKPSIKKSFSAKALGRGTRSLKKLTNPAYGKKGMGLLHPERAVKSKIYKATTVGIKDVTGSRSKSGNGSGSSQATAVKPTDADRLRIIEQMQPTSDSKQDEPIAMLKNILELSVSGAKRIQLMVEADACDECKTMSEKTYTIAQAKKLTFHAGCRCSFTAVPDIDDVNNKIEAARKESGLNKSYRKIDRLKSKSKNYTLTADQLDGAKRFISPA